MVMVTVWWPAAGLVHYSFLNPGETITSEKYAQQIDEMHQKLQCWQPVLVNRKSPFLLHNNAWLHVTQATLQKLNESGYRVLLQLAFSPDLSPTDYFFKHLDNLLQRKHCHILTTFCRENTATTGRIQKNAFQVFVESWNIDFDVIGIKKLIPCWQNVLIVMVLILINEDVFESSYNDLKFTLQNYNYFCTKYFCTKSIP